MLGDPNYGDPPWGGKTVACAPGSQYEKLRLNDEIKINFLNFFYLEDEIISPKESSLDEDEEENQSLADDDSIDAEGFARSRLIVGSVDSESSSLQQESRSSVNSSKSLATLEDQLSSQLTSTAEEVFCEDNITTQDNSLFIKSSSQHATISTSPLESPDSIVALDSDPSSLVDSLFKDDIPPICTDSSLPSSESIEILSANDSIASPSSNSIEVS